MSTNRIPVCECPPAPKDRPDRRASGRFYLGVQACLFCGHLITDRETVRRLKEQRREQERRAMGRKRKRTWADRQGRGPRR